MKIQKFYEHLNNDKVITTTYQTTIPSEEDGDEAEYDQGWEDEDGESMLPDEYDIEEGITAVDKAAEFLKRKRYTTEPSSGQFHVGLWYSTPDPDQNYSTGENTYYSCFLNGFTPEEEYEIWRIMTNFKEVTDKYNL
jgi:hypothetical protein